MDWTTEKRYLPYSKWDAEYLLELQAQADQSAYQIRYHIRPSSGLLNDPNGFSYFNGEYHVFYQSFPFGAVHGLKSWMHLSSPDLVHWRNLGLAIAPDTEYDSHGAYSGSAKQIGNQLFIMYTGNVRDDNWVRIPYQNGAFMDKTGKITKFAQPLFKNPTHISEHFRDPQIVEENGQLYALIGAQDQETKRGLIDVYHANSLHDWQEVGELDFTPAKLGYMVECPNLVSVDEKQVLIFCPQGLEQEVAPYQNIYPNMYVIAQGADLANAKLDQAGALQNLDEGFDVYATQAFNAPNGQAYAISWVGLPDISYPTDHENWANCLSQVKELHIKNGHLYQTPVPAMKDLRLNKTSFADHMEIDQAGQQYELELQIASDQQGCLFLAASSDEKNALKLKFDTEHGQLIIDRSHTDQPFASDFGDSRKINLAAHQSLKLDLFIDHSLAEVFINDGEKVATLRFFCDPSHQAIKLVDTQFTAHYYQLGSI